MSEFKTYHPIVNFIYFAAVIALSMLLMHPVCLAISVVCSVLCSIVFNGRKAVKFNLSVLLPLFILSAIFNPVFNHEGVTILMYLPSKNPLTLESVIYGAAAAAMLISVICWFSCYNSVMTSDKFVYLFGRIIPSMSLILSMVLRFVPRFKAQFREISNAQRCLGRDISRGSIINRAKTAVTILSAMISWALESSIETSNSMKSRGYGLKGRSAFSIYKFDNRDGFALLYIIFLTKFAGILRCSYFPSIIFDSKSALSISVFIAYFMLGIMPVIIEIREEVRWKALRLKI